MRMLSWCCSGDVEAKQDAQTRCAFGNCKSFIVNVMNTPPLPAGPSRLGIVYRLANNLVLIRAMHGHSAPSLMRMLSWRCSGDVEVEEDAETRCAFGN
ncbi:hypothetical protein [Bradyrhizobium japonicum]|uniref:hypothetical protein n=1 Tax=Bradyrhizobium japonicum TaxID=375 RepID=UPI0012699964|nr:hypothetical protein [Bradyrhizobium japonicum]